VNVFLENLTPTGARLKTGRTAIRCPILIRADRAYIQNPNQIRHFAKIQSVEFIRAVRWCQPERQIQPLWRNPGSSNKVFELRLVGIRFNIETKININPDSNQNQNPKAREVKHSFVIRRFRLGQWQFLFFLRMERGSSHVLCAKGEGVQGNQFGICVIVELIFAQEQLPH